MKNRSSDVVVVIPTRNRRDAAVATVQSVLASDHPDLQVVVFDNASSDGTREALHERFAGRFTYRRSERTLAMVDSFEAAYEDLSCEWVFGLGADDGVHPSMLTELLRLAAETELPVAVPTASFFHWPGAREEDCPGQLRVPPIRPDSIVSSSRQVRRVLLGQEKQFTLPSAYYGLVHTDVMGRLRSRNGRVFTSQTPDVGLRFATASVVPRYAMSGRPGLIVGLGRGSNGASQFGGRDPRPVEEFWRENRSSSIPLHPDFRSAGERLPPSLPIVILEAYRQSKPQPGWMERFVAGDVIQAALMHPPDPETAEWLKRFLTAGDHRWFRAGAVRHGTARLLGAIRLRIRRLGATFSRVLARIGRVVGAAPRAPAPKFALRRDGIDGLEVAAACLTDFLDRWERS